MSICSIEWVICLLTVSAVFTRLNSVWLRQAFFALCNVGFLITQVPDYRAWLLLLIFTGTGYGSARLMVAYPRKSILAGYLFLLVAAFLILKQYAFIKPLLPAALFSRTVAAVGLSYMLFRQIQVVVDAYQGQLEELSFWNYFNYQFNLFGFVAGPIQRYQDFIHYWTRLSPVLLDAEAILKAYLRVFIGVVKIGAIAAGALSVYDYCAHAFGGINDLTTYTRIKSTLLFLGMFYLYPIYIYANFSGYCDMVIGGASLLGVKMPENFDRPFFSRNMIEYWTRWHRTLGIWIRDYLFTPMYRGIAARWPRNAASLTFLCYFVALFLAGVWHGSTWNFVIFGLLNGIGVSAAKLWENHLIKRGGRQGLRTYLQSVPIRRAAVFANFNFVCFTVLFFPTDLDRTFKTLKQVLIRLT